MESSGRTTGSGGRQALRASAVRAVLDGQKNNAVAVRFGVTRQTLRNWVARHRHGGEDALADRPKGRAPRRMLLPWQDALVAGAIRVLSPRTVDPRHGWWTRGAIAAYIRLSFGIPFKHWQVDSHLRGWGFSSYREARRAFVGHAGWSNTAGWAPPSPGGTHLPAFPAAPAEGEKATQPMR